MQGKQFDIFFKVRCQELKKVSNHDYAKTCFAQNSFTFYLFSKKTEALTSMKYTQITLPSVYEVV